MHARSAFRIGVVGAAVAMALSAGLTPAYAADLGDQGTAELGSVNVQRGGTTSTSGPIIGCDMNGQTTGTTPGVTYPGVSFGAGATTCTKEPNNDANILVKGTKFELNLFNTTEYGRRLIRVKTFEATCKSTEGGTQAGFKLGGYSGFTLPNPVPSGHVVMVPGKNSTKPPVAKIIVNKSETDGQGAIALTAMRIVLDPQDGYGDIGGTINVGVTACKPTW